MPDLSDLSNFPDDKQEISVLLVLGQGILIALAKQSSQIMRYIFSYFSKKTCGYSLEAPHRGTSNEYPQHNYFFLQEIRKKCRFFVASKS